MSDDTGDVELLLKAVKGRQKFPRACIDAYDKASEGGSDATETVFWENGTCAWLAYVVTKRAAESTAHASGKARRRRLLERIEAQDVGARRGLAARVASTIGPERDRIQAIVRIAPDDAQRLVAEVSLSLGYAEGLGILQVGVADNKTEHIAMELFGAHTESEDGVRYIYLGNGTTRAIPNPSLILKGCRLAAIRQLFGAEIADAAFASSAYRRELEEGRGESTDCVSMTLTAVDSAEICILLSLEKAALLRARLYA